MLHRLKLLKKNTWIKWTNQFQNSQNRFQTVAVSNLKNKNQK